VLFGAERIASSQQPALAKRANLLTKTQAGLYKVDESSLKQCLKGAAWYQPLSLYMK
jgi:hypothetical protein